MTHRARDTLAIALLCYPPLCQADEARLAVPDPTAQAVAETALASFYKDDLARHDNASRTALALKFIKLADESQNDAAGRFVALRDAQGLAIQAGDVAATLQATDALVDAFAVDAVASKVGALTRLAPTAMTPSANAAIAEAAIAVSDIAIGVQHFDEASHAVTLATTAASKSHDNDQIASAKKHAASVKQARDSYATYERAMKALEQKPDDAAANTTVGMFLCFTTDDWNKGLPHLTHAADAALQALATRDLASPTKAVDMAILGDDWWEWSKKADRSNVEPGKARAAFWYSKASPELTGLQKRLAENRVAEMSAGAPNSSGRTVDLLPLIDPKRDGVQGAWSLSGKTLVDAGVSRLRIRYQPPAEYDFCITFNRTTGNDCVTQMLSHGQTSWEWIMGAQANSMMGFETVGGKSVSENSTGVHKTSAVTSGVKHTAIVKVRHDLMAAFLDGALVTQYHTNYTDVTNSAPWDVGAHGLGVGALGSTVEFASIKIVEITGRGKPLPPGP